MDLSLKPQTLQLSDQISIDPCSTLNNWTWPEIMDLWCWILNEH